MALSLAATAQAATTQRREELLQSAVRRQHSTVEQETKRTRRPAAIMRHNVEVARLMALPGTKQRVQTSHVGDGNGKLEPVPANQPPRERERSKRERPERASAAGEAASLPAHVQLAPVHKDTSLLNRPDESVHRRPAGEPVPSVPAQAAQALQTALAPQTAQAGPRVPAAQTASPAPAAPPVPATPTAPAVPAAPVAPRPPTLPYATSIPPELLEPRVIITDVVIRAVVAPGQTSGSVRRVMGVVLNKHRDKEKGDKTPAAAEPEPEVGKRKRRPPSWLSATEWVDDDAAEDGVQPEFNTCRRRAAPLVTVAAAIDECRSRVLSAVPPVCICVYGIVPPAVCSERERAMQERAHATRRTSPAGNSMPPPLHVPSERSPRLTGQGSRSPRDRVGSAGGPSPRIRPKQDGFAVYFGDLPSPRIIEVIKAKEVLLPGWRTTAAPPRPAAGLAGGGGPVPRAAPGEESSSEDDEEATTDEAFERRHTRTLERAILAARKVARDMALKDRERKQAAAHTPAADEGPGGKLPADDEDWKFRPSELAALCAAASMNWTGDGDAQVAGSSSAGFFGLGGANRGADNEKKAAGGDANNNGEAASAGEAGSEGAERGEGGEDGASDDGGEGTGTGYEDSEEEQVADGCDGPFAPPPEADALIESILSPRDEAGGFGLCEPGAANGVMPDAMAIDGDTSPLLSPLDADDGSGRGGSSSIDEIEGEMDEIEGEMDEIEGEIDEMFTDGGRASPALLPPPMIVSGRAGESGGSIESSSAYGGVEMESGEGTGEESGEEEEDGPGDREGGREDWRDLEQDEHSGSGDE